MKMQQLKQSSHESLRLCWHEFERVVQRRAVRRVRLWGERPALGDRSTPGRPANSHINPEGEKENEPCQ